MSAPTGSLWLVRRILDRFFIHAFDLKSLELLLALGLSGLKFPREEITTRPFF